MMTPKQRHDFLKQVFAWSATEEGKKEIERIKALPDDMDMYDANTQKLLDVVCELITIGVPKRITDPLKIAKFVVAEVERLKRTEIYVRLREWVGQVIGARVTIVPLNELMAYKEGELRIISDKQVITIEARPWRGELEQAEKPFRECKKCDERPYDEIAMEIAKSKIT